MSITITRDRDFGGPVVPFVRVFVEVTREERDKILHKLLSKESLKNFLLFFKEKILFYVNGIWKY